MKTITKTISLGLVAKLPVAESIDEFNKLAKDQNAVLNAACDNETYRSTLPQWWNAVASVVEQRFKVPFITKPHPKDATKTVIAESDKAYLARVIGLAKTTVAEVQAIGDRISAGKEPMLAADGSPIVVDGKPAMWTITFDPSKAEPTTRTTKPSKSDLAMVAPLRQRKDFAKLITNINKALSSNLTPTSTDEEIATALGEFRRAQTRAAEQKAKEAVAALIG